jgi:uncharacterized membrane protein
VAAFFAEATFDQQRVDVLNRYQVSYVFYGPAERQLGGFDPTQASYLDKVYDNGEATIYRVGSTGDLPEGSELSGRWPGNS